MARRPPSLAVDTMDDDPAVSAAVNRVKSGQILDRSRRDVGEISPPYKASVDANGEDVMAHFTQPDSYGVLRYFGADGIRVKRDGELPDGTKPAQKGAKARAPVAQVDRAIVQQTGIDEDDEIIPGAPLQVDDVNLTAWMLQKEKHAFSVVRKAIEKRFSKVCMSEAEAFDFLVGQGVVTVEQLRAAGVKLTNDA